MNTLDKTQLRELIIKGEQLQAIKLVMKQTHMGLKEATEYVDEYCQQEKIEVGKGAVGPSYSATKENDTIIYYKIENGIKEKISKEEAPELLVEKMESFVEIKQPPFITQERTPNYKKLRRFLAYICIPLIFVALFFLYQIYTSQSITLTNFIGAFVCSEIVFLIIIIELVLWLIDLRARQQKMKLDEMGIPYEFVIKGRMAKNRQLGIDFMLFMAAAIMTVCSVMLFIGKKYLYGLYFLVLLAGFVFFIIPDFIRDIKDSKQSLHISGTTIHIYHRNEEIAAISAATAVCEILCFNSMGTQLKGYRMSYQFFGTRYARAYPRARLSSPDESLCAEVFLDLQEYRLLKKYLIQRGATITDFYNHD